MSNSDGNSGAPTLDTDNREVTSHIGGYEADFVPALDNKYRCPVCMAALREPVQTLCGHRFCQQCLHRSAGSRIGRCPVDNTHLDLIKEVFPDNATKREVLSLITRCQFSECDWTGELRHRQEHIENCPSVHIPCPNVCGVTCSRCDIHEHLTMCPRRQVNCHHCDVAYVASELSKHQLLKCPKFPVNCAVCGETGILREAVATHVSVSDGACPLVTIPCSFEHVGCYFQDKRKNMPHHYEDAAHHHMLLMTTRFVQHTEKISQQHQEMEDISGKFDRLFELSVKQDDMIDKLSRLLEKYSTEDPIPAID